jgi:hypothetical protein
MCKQNNNFTLATVILEDADHLTFLEDSWGEETDKF